MTSLKNGLYCVVVVMFIWHATLGQTASQKQENQAARQESNLMLNQPSIKTSTLDGPVDPHEYIVGPGDIFTTNLIVNPPMNLQIPVTPEGSIIIPTVGEIQVAGITLDSVKRKALQVIRKKYFMGDVVFTLTTPRVFNVTVKGFVANEGIMAVQATEHVDVVIALANDPENQNLRTMLKEFKPKEDIDARLMNNRKGSHRRIQLNHKDGTTSIADLEKFYALRRSELNPLLRDGDVIVVPKTEITRDFVGVYGAVNGEGVYEFVNGDSLSTILKIARGLTAIADSTQIEVFRVSDSGSEMQTFTLDLCKIIRGIQNDFVLQRGDRVVVREKPEVRRDDKVYIDGEVRNVGYFPITKDSTKLSDVIRQAGGFTEYVSLATSQLHRRSVSEYEIKSERLESARGGVTPEDSSYFYMETNIRLNRELVVTDFVGLFEKNDKSKDVFLRNGDYISIASRKKTVYVFGQVVNPGHILFVPGSNDEYYISKAGGFTEYARKHEVRIIKANTKQWLDPSETTIEDGDYVWVPKEPYRPFSYYMDVYSKVFGIVGTVVSLFVLVIRKP
ncbi:MAG TPA: SLBB domain-containing protein [Bacteroidota bacterium]|nr:SLBB domain-containing protein [Bacteroidota bacterium]